VTLRRLGRRSVERGVERLVDRRHHGERDGGAGSTAAEGRVDGPPRLGHGGAASDVSGGERAPRPLASAGVEARSAKTILICEDEDALRELIRAILGPRYRYGEAADGEEALDLAHQIRPDLVILDLMLPGRSGLEVLAALRDRAPNGHTPVVVVTAWSHAEEAVLAAGADRFLGKPFEPEELQAAVEELLG
jgi:CheY-like chemotaxis protein